MLKFLKSLFCMHNNKVCVAVDNQCKTMYTLWLCPCCGKFSAYNKNRDIESTWHEYIPLPITKWKLTAEGKAMYEADSSKERWSRTK